jgi:hypothetical protein
MISEAVNRKTDNTMTKRKTTKRQQLSIVIPIFRIGDGKNK